MTPQNKYITTAEAAVILDVGVRHVRHLIQIGELQSVVSGRHKTLDRAEVESYKRKPVGNPNFNKGKR